MKRSLLIPDAHAHIGSREELAERLDGNIPTMLNIGTLEEAGMVEPFLQEETGRDIFIPSYGIHPWYADKKEDPFMKDITKKYPIRGEIGMDSVWCSVPLSVQKQVLKAQLQIAQDQKKPVVLHTKGQEQVVAEQISLYPNRYLVHWFSSREGLQAYLDLDCYVSIGPDVWWNEAVQLAAVQVPLHRILIETDGMSAVHWAYREGPKGMQAVCPGTVKESLERTLGTVAVLRGIQEDTLADQVLFNFHCFTRNC